MKRKKKKRKDKRARLKIILIESSKKDLSIKQTNREYDFE